MTSEVRSHRCHTGTPKGTLYEMQGVCDKAAECDDLDQQHFGDAVNWI